MTEHLLAISRDLGTDTTYLLATELGAPVYSKAGFQDDGAYEFYQLPKTIPPNPESAVLIPIQPSHWAAILELDRITTGEHRMVLLSKHLPQGYACLESGELTGYYLPTWGDGLIVAKTEDAGLAMLLQRLESKEIACLPVENVHAASVLTRLEARPFRTIKKMRFGPERDWKPQFIYNRIGGNLG